VQKRYLIHVAGYDLGLIMRLLTGAGTPREFHSLTFAWLIAFLEPDGDLIAVIGEQLAAFAATVRPDSLG
jgi:transposase